MWDKLKQDLETKYSFKFNLNQWRETQRLIYEISKREDCAPEQVTGLIKDISKVENAGGRDTFFALKAALLRLRFPLSSAEKKLDPAKVFLPEFKKQNSSVYHPNAKFKPEKIYIEKQAKGSYLEKKFIEHFPEAEIEELSSYKDYIKNFRYDPCELKKPVVFIVKEHWDFIKPCPCTKNVMGCKYWIFNLGFGCPFDCSYCFLQQYSNIPGIVLPANLDDFFEKFDVFYKKLKQPIRIGTGEFCDSLALDHITGYAPLLIDYFRDKDLFFELKTKSSCIKNVLKTKASSNIVFSWSLNPPQIIDSEEWASADLDQRLEAAAKVREKGFSLAFHFDPIIFFPGWEKLYLGLVDKLYSRLKPPFRWVSLGTLRANRELKTIVEKRFPQSKIFYQEFFLGQDKKLRYPEFLKTRIFKTMLKTLRSYDQQTPFYLCMEHKDMWDKCGFDLNSSQEVEKYLLGKKQS